MSTSQEAGGLKATVDSSVFLGLNTHYFAHTDEGERIEIIQESQIDSVIPDGAVIRLGGKNGKDKRVWGRRRTQPAGRRARRQRGLTDRGAKL